jgi:hypothetical protein
VAMAKRCAGVPSCQLVIYRHRPTQGPVSLLKTIDRRGTLLKPQF